MTNRTEPESSHGPRNSRLVPILLVILFFLPLGLVTWWALRDHGDSRTEQYEKRIRERGEPLTLEDLQARYPEIPEAENGATAILAIWERDEPDFRKRFTPVVHSASGYQEPSWDPDLPFLGSNARSIPRSTRWSATNLALAEEFVAANVERFNEMRAAIRNPPHRFPVRITDGFNALLPHLGRMRNEGDRFRIAADLATERGDIEAALGAIEDLVITGHVLKPEPLLISQLVRLSIYGQAIGAAERLLCRHSLSEKQLDVLKQHLGGIQTTNTLYNVLLAERAEGLSVFNMSPEEMSAVLNADDAKGFQWGLRFMSMVGMKRADHLLMLDTMEKAIALSQTNSAESVRQFQKLFAEFEVETRRFPPKILSSLLLGGLESVPKRIARFEGKWRAALTAIAVEKFRLQNQGRLPASLEEITTLAGTEVILDPFDDAPLRYRSLTNGYVVYSIGPNGVDDGGTERKGSSGRDENFDETFFVERESR